jgi:hypothetical protein
MGEASSPLSVDSPTAGGQNDTNRPLCRGVTGSELLSREVVTDWRAWHADYDDPSTSLSRRLEVVRTRVRDTLASRPAGGQWRILSLCSGDGRDLLPEMAGSDKGALRAVLVEQDNVLAGDAAATASRLGLERVSVVVGDAGETATFIQHVPADLVLLCGIFGNISEHDIAVTVNATPSMLRDGGTVIWTRGSSDPDLRPRVRRWFIDAGLGEISFDSEPDGFGVGVARAPARRRRPPRLPDRLFTFTR